MPKVSSLPRFSRNLAVYGRFAVEWRRTRGLRRRLVAAAAAVDLIHFNHEALFLLARWLKPRAAKPFTMHIRTNLWESDFARWQCRTVARTIDHLVFITENEEATFRDHGGIPKSGSVIYNIAEPKDLDVEPHPGVPQENTFRIACLSNYSYSRGTDRLVDVATELRSRGRHDIRFVVAGDVVLDRSLPGALGRLGRIGCTLADYASERGVAEYFHFLGHVPNPEQVLVACHALAKPTRENNPWGRDIIEALAAGRPVLSVGRCDTFVETGATGVLQDPFDAKALASWMIRLADDRGLVAQMGAAGRDRVSRLCDGSRHAACLLAVWRDLSRHAACLLAVWRDLADRAPARI